MRAFCLACAIAAIAWTATAADRFIVIGCVSRDAQRQFVLTDTRTEPPTVYRLNGSDETTLTFHIGHTLEIAGALAVGPPKAITVESLTYLATTCVKLKPTEPSLRSPRSLRAAQG